MSETQNKIAMSGERKHTPLTIEKYIGTATYDAMGQIIFCNDGSGLQMLADVRGWGHMQNVFADQGEFTEESQQAAMNFQDSVGQFITDAINEKIAGQAERDTLKEVNRELVKTVEGTMSKLLETYHYFRRKGYSMRMEDVDSVITSLEAALKKAQSVNG